MRSLIVLAFAGLAGTAAAAAEPAADFAWAFPPAASGRPPRPAATDALVSPPGVKLKLTEKQVRGGTRTVDWRPKEHPPAPATVLAARPGVAFACGYCHLIDGAGRPENATVAGLPASYIVAQANAFAHGERNPAVAGWRASVLMAVTAKAATAAEIQAAADYFSKLKFTSRVRVVERARIPRMIAGGGLYSLAPGGGEEALGQRIVEAPDDFEQFELRDSHTTFTAYAPPGSVARGRRFAATGGGKGAPCASCHGVGLKGAEIGPPLAGRSPTYLVRQLVGFQTGARADAGAALMKPVVQGMTVAEMIDLAAYAGSLKP